MYKESPQKGVLFKFQVYETGRGKMGTRICLFMFRDNGIDGTGAGI